MVSAFILHQQEKDPTEEGFQRPQTNGKPTSRKTDVHMDNLVTAFPVTDNDQWQLRQGHQLVRCPPNRGQLNSAGCEVYYEEPWVAMGKAQSLWGTKTAELKKTPT